LKFDDDTKALKKRIQSNVEGALYSLEDWIIDQVKPCQGMQISDLGCGTGKQIFSLAPLVLEDGLVLGLDISADAINEVKERAEREQLKQVKAIQGSIDECIYLLQDYKFDLILSTYAIYYARNMKEVLSELPFLMNPKGHVFVCGPGFGTNQEMIALVNGIIIDPVLKLRPVENFINQADISEIGRFYSSSSIAWLDNHIRFVSLERVLQWWQNHNSFIPEILEPVKQALEYHFAQKGDFVLTKKVLGIHYYA